METSLRESVRRMYEHFRCDQGVHPYIQSIGEADVGPYNDTAMIHVMLVREPYHFEEQIPATWEGFPVETRVTGRMRLI